MARIVVGAVGAVVGFYLGGPVGALQGFTIAYGLSAGLDPNKKILGPKLSDLRAPQATYGSPIPYVEGAPRLAGCYIWASDKREIATTTTEGKGGPGVDSTSFTYEIDCLIELAINRCDAIRRVWSNGRLVWTNGDDADGDSISASAATNSWRDMRYYDGADDQLPDPTYEAAVGIGNAPAYRGRSTVMIEGLNLGGSGQLPILTFEIVSEAEVAAAASVFADVPAGGIIGQGSSPFSADGCLVFIGQWDSNYLNTQVIVFRVDAGTSSVVTVFDAPANNPSGHGQTDTAGIMSSVGNISIGGSDRVIYWNELGDLMTAVEFIFLLPNSEPSNAGGRFGGAQLRFCMAGDVVCFGSTGFGSGKIYRYSKAAGTSLLGADPIGETAALDYCDALATDGVSWLYKLRYFTATVDVFDLATMTLQETLPDPTGGNPSATNGSIVVEDGILYLIEGNLGIVYVWDGAAWSVYMPSVVGPYVNELSQYGISDGVIFQMTSESVTNLQRIHMYSGRIAAGDVTLDQVVRRLSLRTGQLTDDDIDVTELASDIVRAMAVTQVGPTRATLEMLMIAYMFECVEGETIRFVKRGGASVVTIPYDDLAAGQDGTAEPLPLKRMNDVEVAARVSIKFGNVLNDFQDGLVRADRLVTESTAEALIELPIGFTPGEAAKLADANTMDLAVGLIQIGPISLSRKYAALEPTDVVTVTNEESSTFRARITKGTIGGGVHTFELVLDDATVVNSEASTDEDYASSTLIRLLALTDLELLDIPILRDVDNTPGFYAAFGATGAWPGAEFLKSPDDITYDTLFNVNSRAVLGVAESTLGDFTGGNVFDEINALDVDVGEGVLTSTTRAALLGSTENALLVGAEIIQFRGAVATGPGLYTLTGLLRGLRGTEWAMPDHVASERVVRLQTLGIRRVVEEASEIGVTNYYKGVTIGKSAAALDAELFADTGVGLKPFAPVNLRALPNAVGDIEFSWNRRTRLSTRFVGASPLVPLGEATERYWIQVRSGPSTVLFGLYVTGPSYTFTRGSQDENGVYTGVGVEFDVMQVSATVGLGYPATIGFEGTGTATAQISTLTLGGTFQSGKGLFVKIDSTTVNYTTTVPDATLAGIATSLASAIQSALPTYTASALSGVITITGPLGHAFTLDAGMVGADQFPSLLWIAPAPAGPGVAMKIVVGISAFAGGFSSVSGASYTLRLFKGTVAFPFRIVTYTYTATTDGWNAVQLMTAIIGGSVTTSDGLPATVFWSFDQGFGNFPTANTPVGEYWETQGFVLGDANAFFTASIAQLPVAPHPTDVAQESRIWFVHEGLPAGSFSTPVGYVYRARIDGVDYDYTVQVSDDWFDVIAGLETAINLGPGAVVASDAYYLINYATQPPQLSITAAVGNVPFTVDSYLVPGLITITPALVQDAA